jgi:predicted component of type VI protein secretion system
VLLANTAVPAWHEAYPELPFVFAGSALASGGGVGLAVAPLDEVGPARRMLLLGAAVELAASRRLEGRLGLVGEPYRTGRPGALLQAGKLLTAAAATAAAAGSLAGRRTRTLNLVSGVLANAGAVSTRFGIFLAGRVSAADPRYTVLPQRQRLDEQGAAAGSPGPASGDFRGE